MADENQQTDTLTNSTPTTENSTPVNPETPTVGAPTTQVEPITVENPVNATNVETPVEPPKMPARYTYDVYHVENPHDAVFQIIACEDYPGKITDKVYKVMVLTTDDPKQYTLTLRTIELL